MLYLNVQYYFLINHEYQVHLKEGDGTMHLYTGADKADALEYIKFYEKSHGDMKLIKFKK